MFNNFFYSESVKGRQLLILQYTSYRCIVLNNCLNQGLCQIVFTTKILIL